MKTYLICLLICLALTEPSYSLCCRNDLSVCKEGECCIEVGIFGRCKPLLQKGEICELKQRISFFDNRVYLKSCPCGEGLTCQRDNSGSPDHGRCV